MVFGCCQSNRNLPPTGRAIHSLRKLRLRAPFFEERAEVQLGMAVGLLASDIQKALLTATAPPGLDPEKLLSRDMPLDWEGQRTFLGFTARP